MADQSTPLSMQYEEWKTRRTLDEWPTPGYLEWEQGRIAEGVIRRWEEDLDAMTGVTQMADDRRMVAGMQPFSSTTGENFDAEAYGVQSPPPTTYSSVRLIGVPICPDLLRYSQLGAADNSRGRVVRAFFYLMRFWPDAKK